MRHSFVTALLATSVLISPAVAEEKKADTATPKEIGTLTVTVKGLENGAPIDPRHAYCVPKDGLKSSETGSNVSPEVSWTKGPEGTVSYALIMVDKDVPTDFTDAGKSDKTIPADMPRQNFYHWVVADIPAEVTTIPEGTGKLTRVDAVLEGKRPVGKPLLNDYAKFKPGQPKDIFIGYDGPCPPWNDARIHNYHFQVYALSATSADYFSGSFKNPQGKEESYKGVYEFNTGEQLYEQMQPHILAKGEVVGTYTLNPELVK